MGIVERVFNSDAARAFGLEEGQITVMLHSGSRGLGYQVCDDSLKVMQRAGEKYHLRIPDRQLACAPAESREGRQYLAAMSAAANYAWRGTGRAQSKTGLRRVPQYREDRTTQSGR